MTIIQIEPLESGIHPIQSQSHRREVWLEGYIEVPAHLDAAVWASCGWCDLTIEDGKLVGITPTEKPPEPGPSVEEQITAKKAELTATDYQIIKCSEYQLSGRKAPYNVEALHIQRQAIRDEINTLEGKEGEVEK